MTTNSPRRRRGPGASRTYRNRWATSSLFVALCGYSCVRETQELPVPCCQVRTICCDDDLQPNRVADLVDFGDVPVGTSAIRPIEITNIGNRQVVISEFIQEGAWSTIEYQFGVDNHRFDLEAGEFETIDVFFTALEETADYVGVSLLIMGDEGESGVVHMVNVALRARGSNIPAFESSPSPLDFGEVPVGSTLTLPLALTNHLLSPVDVVVDLDVDGHPSIESRGTGSFEILNPLSSTGSVIPVDHPTGLLGRDESISLNIRYRPADNRGDEAVFVVRYCDFAECEHRVTLRGSG